MHTYSLIVSIRMSPVVSIRMIYFYIRMIISICISF